MTSGLSLPDWTPKPVAGMRILVIGGTGGLGRALIAMLAKSDVCAIGAHGGTQIYESDDPRILPLVKKLGSEADCASLVDTFAEQAGGIDALVALSGAIHYSGHWKDMPADDWERDIGVNLNQPFYLARAAMRHMTAEGSGGRIVLNGTESALHGGSAMSFPYAIAKRGTECMVEGLAREGAPDNILVNGVRLGCIRSGFHERWHNKTDAEMDARIDLIPLKRAGEPDEAAALICYLLSGWAGFITGQMIPLTGGDWL